MREYEAMIIAKMDIPEAELTKMINRWESIVNANGGEIVKKQTPVVRRLAYPIQKQNRANYFIYDVATTQENILELERVLKFDENVLRSLVTKLSDSINVAERRLELQREIEEAARREAESAREKAESESLGARRGSRDEADEEV